VRAPAQRFAPEFISHASCHLIRTRLEDSIKGNACRLGQIGRVFMKYSKMPREDILLGLMLKGGCPAKKPQPHPTNLGQANPTYSTPM
jgi:hypothetical protein